MEICQNHSDKILTNFDFLDTMAYEGFRGIRGPQLDPRL